MNIQINVIAGKQELETIRNENENVIYSLDEYQSNIQACLLYLQDHIFDTDIFNIRKSDIIFTYRDHVKMIDCSKKTFLSRIKAAIDCFR